MRSHTQVFILAWHSDDGQVCQPVSQPVFGMYLKLCLPLRLDVKWQHGVFVGPMGQKVGGGPSRVRAGTEVQGEKRHGAKAESPPLIAGRPLFISF